MRLLKADDGGIISLTRPLTDIPAYAILSHTWADDESEEVMFAEVETITGRKKEGYKKIRFCAELAKKDNLEHFWVDTCCIDRDNHNELSEAIHSMFSWYQCAQKCYVYLSDVSTCTRKHDCDAQCSWESSFRSSRWFRRSWTLQELLAPPIVEFISREGTLLGCKASLLQQISETTKIPIKALEGTPLTHVPVEEKLRWTKDRRTREKEDKADCLLRHLKTTHCVHCAQEKDKAITLLGHKTVAPFRSSRREMRWLGDVFSRPYSLVQSCCRQSNLLGKCGFGPVIPLAFVGWAGSAVAHRYVQQRQNPLTQLSTESYWESWQSPRFALGLTQQCYACRLMLQAVGRPNTAVFLLACVIFAFSYLCLVWRQRHWQHESLVSMCLLVSAISCAYVESAETVLVEFIYRYLPISVLSAEVASLLFGSWQPLTSRNCDQL